MQQKERNHKPKYRLIATGFFASTTCWFVVDNFIVPFSVGKYIVIEILMGVMGVMGALYAFEKSRLSKNDKININ